MKTNKLFMKIGLICSTLLLFAFIPKGDDPIIDKLVAALQKWTDTNPQEKVYLHMDKPYYAIGDTVWFKGYVTVGSRHQLSALSGALYVDLVTDHDSLVRSLKLPVLTGMVIGSFPLGDDLKEGSYRIRAYTRWMRNAGEEYFFDKTFVVGDLASDNIIAKADYKYKTVNNKPILTALLNYTDGNGKAFAEKDVRYQIIINHKTVWNQSLKTDALGSLNIEINNENKGDLRGAYIRTIIDGPDKQPIFRDFPIKAISTETDVQFFPESGNLVNGLSCRVAFKAVGIDGLGAEIKGKIVDDANNEVGDIETTHAGMGSFLMRPESGKNYSAKITFADGSTRTIALPKAADDGFVVGVYQPNKDSILVRVSASAKQVAAGATINLIAQTNGEVIVATPVKIARASTSLWMEKKLFPTGVTQFTLFNNAGEPLNERVAFIRSNDLMTVNIKSAKNTFKPKEPIKLDIQALDSKGAGTLGGNFSVSVMDESRVPVDENSETTIFTNILLTSDLKGYIEKPNYYFNNPNEDVDKALDNLMLTQGYRRFTWKTIDATNAAKPIFEAEGLGAKITGTVLTLGKKPMPNANVNLISLRGGIAKTISADEEGKFKFDNILLGDSIKFSVIAKSAKNSDNAIIVMDTIPRIFIGKNKNIADVSTNIHTTLKEYLANGQKLDDLYEKTGQLDKVQRLREVRIRAKKAKFDKNITPQGMYQVPEQSADKVITFSEGEAESYTTLAQALQGRLQGIGITQGQYGSEFEALGARGSISLSGASNKDHISMYVDGRKIISEGEPSEILDGSILPEDVARIEVVRTNQAMVNMLGGPAVLIVTKLGTGRKQYNPNVANISPKGFNKVREFYSPKYDSPASQSIPDLRTTVYWNPYLKTDATGVGSFNFYNADGPGSYRVVIEGINAAGEVGRQVYKYTVQ